MSDELVDIYDDAFKKIGTALKSEARKKGYWVSSIHCWIINPKDNGFVLFQKRGSEKLVFPNALDVSAAGHYKAGEKIKDGVREISEEIGLSVDYKDLIPLGVKFDVALTGKNVVHEYCQVFFLIKDRKPEFYELAEDEVEGLVEISIPDGLSLFANEIPFVDAKGVEYDKKNKIWKKVTIKVNKDLFIPRTDPYYYKIFIMAERLLAGNKYVAI